MYIKAKSNISSNSSILNLLLQLQSTVDDYNNLLLACPLAYPYQVGRYKQLSGHKMHSIQILTQLLLQRSLNQTKCMVFRSMKFSSTFRITHIQAQSCLFKLHKFMLLHLQLGQSSFLCRTQSHSQSSIHNVVSISLGALIGYFALKNL